MSKYCSKCGKVPDWIPMEQHHIGKGNKTIQLCRGCHGLLHREYDLAFKDKPKKRFSLFKFTQKFVKGEIKRSWGG